MENKALHAARRFKGTAMRADVDEVSRDGRPATANFVGGLPSPSQVAIASELRERVRNAIATLSPDYQEILRLRQEAHLTMREAAGRMGRSEDAVKKLYARAIARLTNLLDLSTRGRRHE